MNAREAWNITRQAFDDWLEDGAPQLGAALAYYTLFSLAPLLLAAIAIAGLAFGEQAAQGRIVQELESLIGRPGAEAVQQLVENSRNTGSGIAATIVAVVTLLVGATSVFVQLRSALNVVWEVETPQEGVRGMLRARLAGLALVLGIGFLLLVSLVVSAALSAMGGKLAMLSAETTAAMQVLNTVVSLGVITALFAMLFKFLPDKDVAWRDVWTAAAATSLLFTIGKFLIGLYLAKSSLGSVFGAAASIVILMVWVYYSAQIFFFGAELAQAYSQRRRARSSLHPEGGAARSLSAT